MRCKQSHYATSLRLVAPRPSPQTDRVIRLIEMLADDQTGEGLRLADVSRRLGVHKASCHSMLASLLEAGWLVRDPRQKSYHLGPALVRVGATVSSRFPAQHLVRSALLELAGATGAHCIAFSVDEDHVSVIDQVSPHGTSHPITMGAELPLRPPYAVGVIPWTPTRIQEDWLQMLPEGTRARYRRAFAAARQRGYAFILHVFPDLQLQELALLFRNADAHEGRLADLAAALTGALVRKGDWFPEDLAGEHRYQINSIGAPVLDRSGQPVLMLSIAPRSGPITAAMTHNMGELLARTCRRLTTEWAALGLEREPEE